MLKQSLLKLLPVLLLSFAQNAGMMDLLRCEVTPPKVMARRQGDENVEIERLTQQLRSESDTERNDAAIALGKMGTPAQSALTELFILIVISSSPKYIRVNASTSIRQIVESSEAEIRQLLPLLNHPNPDVRANVAGAIGNNRKSNEHIIYRLTVYEQQGEDSNSTIRTNLAATVKQFTNTNRLSSSQLIPLLKDSNPLVRANAVSAILNMRVEARSSLQQLLPLLQDTDSTVRANAVAVYRRDGNVS
jgi:HEAT repeat protein